ncbi:MAG: hypothetical protein ACI9KE_000076 [Polyangiales bacterium]|jgi:hypothetical protein
MRILGYTRYVNHFCATLLGLLLVVGCAKGSGDAVVHVNLRTDYAALAEWTEARIVLVKPGGEEEEYIHTASAADYVSGARVHSFEGLGQGDYEVRGELVTASGRTVGSRRLTFTLLGETFATALITRSCEGIVCPMGDPAATECSGGRCVLPECSDTNRDACDVGCAGDTDCVSSVACAAGLCTSEGACIFEPIEGICQDVEYCDSDRGCLMAPIGDAGVMDSSVPDFDGGTPDAGPTTCDPVCAGFDICEDGVCVPSTGCLTGGECADDLICRNRRCVPPTQDVDGDGSPASEDCNELRPEAYPGAPELCNNLDEDCDEIVDEGNPGVLCTEEGGECMNGTCGCPPGMLDVDGVPDTGCECVITPDEGATGAVCATPFGLGSLADSGQMMTVSGNALPMGREVWYSVIGSDSTDTACDTYDFRARFTDNPGDAFRLDVRRSACDAMSCDMSEAGFTEYSFSTNFRDAAGVGECPCAVAPGQPGRNICSNNTATYYVRVFRRPGAPVTCAPYTLQLSNGI